MSSKDNIELTAAGTAPDFTGFPIKDTPRKEYIHQSLQR